jgi:hypothetical protein
MMLATPFDLDQMQATAQRNLQASATAAGFWQPAYTFGAKIMAEIMVRYCHVTREIHEQRPVQGALAEDMEDWRGVIRDILFNWHWTEPGAAMPPLRSDGIDPDAARLCGLPEDRVGHA